jgi:hypothetical protein
MEGPKIPLGSYKDFDACVASQTKKLGNAKAARRYCGFLYWTIEKHKKNVGNSAKLEAEMGKSRLATIILTEEGDIVVDWPFRVPVRDAYLEDVITRIWPDVEPKYIRGAKGVPLLAVEVIPLPQDDENEDTPLMNQSGQVMKIENPIVSPTEFTQPTTVTGAVPTITTGMSTEELSEWGAAEVNNLPDSCFAYIEPGGSKDEEGKTVPRSLRHLPYKNASGKPDPAHVRNALARLPQTNISAEAKAHAKGKICAAAKELGIESETCKT